MLVKLNGNKLYEEMLDLEELIVTNRTASGNNNYFHVESRNEVGVCPVCGEFVEDIKEYKKYTIRDLPAHGKVTYLVITKKRFCCDDCKITFTENFDCMNYGEVYTNRYMKYVYKRCKISPMTDVILIIFRKHRNNPLPPCN